MDLAAEFAALKPLADLKNVRIAMHTPRTGTYFTMRDGQNGALICKTSHLVMLEDTLTNWIDVP